MTDTLGNPIPHCQRLWPGCVLSPPFQGWLCSSQSWKPHPEVKILVSFLSEGWLLSPCLYLAVTKQPWWQDKEQLVSQGSIYRYFPASLLRSIILISMIPGPCNTCQRLLPSDPQMELMPMQGWKEILNFLKTTHPQNSFFRKYYLTINKKVTIRSHPVSLAKTSSPTWNLVTTHHPAFSWSLIIFHYLCWTPGLKTKTVRKKLCSHTHTHRGSNYSKYN